MIERVPVVGEFAAKASAIGLSTVALVGASPASPAVAANDPNPYTHEDKAPGQTGLRTLEQLPGHNIHVSSDTQTLLENSIVNVYAHESWSSWGNCTGVKIQAIGRTFVSTAAHCFDDETQVPGEPQKSGGELSPADFPQGKALDFIKRAGQLHRTYTVQDPFVPVAERQPLAQVTGIAINTQKTDAALLSVEATSPLTRLSPNKSTQAAVTPPRTYDQIPAIQYARTPRLVPGQEVALASVIASNDNEVVLDTGIYAGRTVNVHFDKGVAYERKNDIVITDPEQPYEDACDFEGSGSVFAAQAKTGSNGAYGTFISNNLSMRNNLKYDPYRRQLERPGRSPKTNLKQWLRSLTARRKDISRQLGIRIERDQTVCEFSVPTTKMRASMLGAFGHYAEPFPEVDDASPRK